MVKTIEHLSLSALSYVDFKESDAGLTLDEIIRDEQKKKSRKDLILIVLNSLPSKILPIHFAPGKL